MGRTENTETLGTQPNSINLQEIIAVPMRELQTDMSSSNQFTKILEKRIRNYTETLLEETGDNIYNQRYNRKKN